MRMFFRLTTAVLTTAVFYATHAEAGSGNSALDHVREWQASMIERVLGKDAAEEFLANPEIIGGKAAKAGKWPGQVALLKADETDNFLAQYCGGALINERYVVTAAHCLDFLTGPEQIEVLTGTQSLATGGTRHAVASYTIHPSWDDETSDYDVGVIRLETPATGLKLNKLINKRKLKRYAKPGKPAVVTGWGKLEEDGNQFPSQLQEAKLPFVARSTCNEKKSYDGEVTKRMICAGYQQGGKDACQGDSGGPLVLKKKKRIQAGIVSWGTGCARPNYYGVYTNISEVRGWILDNID